MIELDDDTVQAIREGALPGVRFYRDSWDQELLFEAPDTLEEFRGLERRQVERQEAVVPVPVDPPPQPAPVERARRKRKPNLDKLIAKAKAAGATSVTTPEGYTYKLGEPGAVDTAADDFDRELADFQERHCGRH
jgi:hypothetical protein